MDSRARPPFRWFLIGPKRSGTPMHIDPNLTSAWNTSLHGHKLWVMVPGHYPKWIINGRNASEESDYVQYSAIDYFVKLLDKVKAEEANLPDLITCIQHPGETVYVPGGWWHAVLNLNDTMAVTQNYCNSQNFDKVWRAVRSARPEISRHFLDRLKEKQLAHYKRALEINSEDSFVMRDLRMEIPFAMDVSTESDDDGSSGGSHMADVDMSSSEEGEENKEDKEKAEVKKKKSNKDEKDDEEDNDDGDWEDEKGDDASDELKNSVDSSDEELEAVLLLNKAEIEYKKEKVKKFIKARSKMIKNKLSKLQSANERRNQRDESTPHS